MPSRGNPAIVGPRADRPEALRPRLSTGLPCFTRVPLWSRSRSGSRGKSPENRRLIHISGSPLLAVGEDRHRRRAADQEALRIADTDLAQGLEHGGRLDALRDRLDAYCPADLDDRLDHAAV